MYKAIVVGTDGSDRAAAAVREALALAKMSGAKLHAVHVVRPVASLGAEHLDPGLVVAANVSMREEAEQVSARLLVEAEREGVPAEMHVLDGDPADALINIAECGR